MRVLLITQTLDRQDSILGATHGLAEQLARRLERLYALQLWAGETALPTNVALRSMGKERGATKPAQLATLTRAVRTLAARGQVDLVFAHMAPLYAIVAAPIARLSGVPTVLWYAHPHVDLKLRLATALVDRVASPTPEGFRVPTAKLTLTGHGVDTERFLPPRTPCQGPLRVLYAGRISRSKDVATFLRAARLALDQSPAGALRFAIIGRPGSPADEAYLAELRVLARSLGLEGALELGAAVPYPRMPEALAQCDLLVNLARTGSADKVVLEAMSCARVPLVCNRTFVPTLGEDAERCLFRERDPGDLARQILRWAAASPEERQAVGQRLRAAVVREHSLSGLAERLVRLFREVIAEARRGRVGAGW